jgi:hypothetical protein
MLRRPKHYSTPYCALCMPMYMLVSWPDGVNSRSSFGSAGRFICAARRRVRAHELPHIGQHPAALPSAAQRLGAQPQPCGGVHMLVTQCADVKCLHCMCMSCCARGMTWEAASPRSGTELCASESLKSLLICESIDEHWPCRSSCGSAAPLS